MVSIRKQTKALQVLPGENKILYHSNRVSRGRYLGMTQLQISLFIEVMIRLQKPIIRSMAGKEYFDLLDIVQGKNIDFDDTRQVKIGIFLNSITKHNHYNKVIEAAQELGNIRIEFKSEDGKYRSLRTIFPRIDEIKKENGKSVLYIYIPISVARKLIEIDRNEYGKPIRYTSYTLDVIRKAKKNKYTFKFYWLISSWKGKKEIKIKFEELKKELGVEDQYKRYAEFRKRVLIPVQKELKELESDCWFEIENEEKDNKKVIFLKFKIFSKKTEKLSKRLETGIEITKILSEKFKFEKFHMDFFNEKIRTHKNYHEDKCLYKIKSIMKWLEKPLNRMEVVSLPDYMLTSLSKFFYQEQKI